MSVRNDSTSSDAMRARDAALAAGQDRPAQPRPPAPAEHVDRFQQLMQHAREGDAGRAGLREDTAANALRPDGAREDASATATREAVTAVGEGSAEGDDVGGDSPADTGLSQRSLEQSDAIAFMQAQIGLRGDAVLPAQAPPPAAGAQAVMDLLERHVRQMAVGGTGAAGDADGQVLLRMSDSTLPGTDLLLSKTADGWMLRADVRSRDSYDAIQQAAPELTKRFAERNLGVLQVDPHFNG